MLATVVASAVRRRGMNGHVLTDRTDLTDVMNGIASHAKAPLRYRFDAFYAGQNTNDARLAGIPGAPCRIARADIAAARNLCESALVTSATLQIVGDNGHDSALGIPAVEAVTLNRPNLVQVSTTQQDACFNDVLTDLMRHRRRPALPASHTLRRTRTKGRCCIREGVLQCCACQLHAIDVSKGVCVRVTGSDIASTGRTESVRLIRHYLWPASKLTRVRQENSNLNLKLVIDVLLGTYGPSCL